ncbi:MAG: radical SAM protein [Acidobacteriota bacterium]
MAYSWERTTADEKAAILDAIAGAPAPPPRVVEISWQDRCNIDCFFCSTSEIRAGNFELSTERLESLFGQMKALGVRGVRLMGGGEPLFRKDAEALIRRMGELGLRISDVTTNAVLLTEPVVRALFATGCDEICVSLNTADSQSYAAMMQTTAKNFDRVLENVRRAAAIKRETGSDCRIRLQFLVYQDNYRQLPQMARVFRESGADSFWLNGLYPVRPMPTMSEEDIAAMLRLYEDVLSEDYFEHLEQFSFWERAIAERIAAATRAVFARAPLRRRAQVKLRHLLDTDARKARAAAQLHEFCLVGWYSMTLNANGDAVTCCILQDHKTAVLGNVHGSSLEEIWLGSAYERFRAELREIMARRGEVGDLSHSCSVEGLCAQKDACPNRSYYWSDDLDFRRTFHETVEAMRPPEGQPFATLAGGTPRLPVMRSPALPVR